MTRILIVDDHDLILEGLESTLRQLSDNIVCVKSYAAAITELSGPDFDVCIIDYGLNPGSGDGLLREIREKMPNTKAICISADFNPNRLHQLKKSGFNGFYSKTDPREEIVAAIESLSDSGIFYSSTLQTMMRESGDIPKLSNRQSQLLGHIDAGMSNEEAAAAMQVKPATVSFHMKHLKQKLGAKNARDIVTRARELGFID